MIKRVSSRRRFAPLALAILPLMLAACQNYYVNVDGFRLDRFRPSVIPSNSSLDIAYNLIVDSDQETGRDKPLPITSFDTHFFLEGEKAVASKMPAGVNSIKLGEPVRMQGSIVLRDVVGLAPKIPILLKKDEWEIGLRGKMGLETLGLNIVKVPLIYKKDIPNPTKNERFRNQLPPELRGILNNL